MLDGSLFFEAKWLNNCSFAVDQLLGRSQEKTQEINTTTIYLRLPHHGSVLELLLESPAASPEFVSQTLASLKEPLVEWLTDYGAEDVSGYAAIANIMIARGVIGGFANLGRWLY